MNGLARVLCTTGILAIQFTDIYRYGGGVRGVSICRERISLNKEKGRKFVRDDFLLLESSRLFKDRTKITGQAHRGRCGLPFTEQTGSKATRD